MAYYEDRVGLIARINAALPNLDNATLLQIATHAECLSAGLARDIPRPRDTVPSGPPSGCGDTLSNLTICEPDQEHE